MKVWKLNDNNFTWLDRLKICKFFLNPNNFWTYNKQVKLYEKKMAEYVGVKHALFVSSGSTANTIIAYYLSIITDKKKIIFPSLTWSTSVSPFIKCGFEPIFVDIDPKNLSASTKQIEDLLRSNDDIAACFITSVLGISPNINELKFLEKKYKVRVLLDNCESLLTTYYGKNISSYFTSTTSTYFGHLLQSVEGGFVFTNNDEEYEIFNMIRNHGMYRHLESERQHKYKNPDVDSQFDFYCIGNNFRNTDIHAFIGLLDFERKEKYIKHRTEIYKTFYSNVNKDKYYVLPYINGNIMMSLPIICNDKISLEKLKLYCKCNNIEYRPIISGNLLRQTAYKKYCNDQIHTNVNIIHERGLYIGLHSGVSKKQIIKFCKDINQN